MSTPLPEAARVKLLSHYIGDVRAWKGDDSAETVIVAVKDPAKDANNQSIYIASKAQLLAGQLTYLGTTGLGKDGGCQPLVFNDGLVVFLETESPAPLDSGSLADLFAVTLQYHDAPEPAASGTTDTWLRARVSAFMVGLRDLAARFV
jgi:hypothetical protein